jgi:23S rRNA (guanosine2251-2'-O)-methyltransferase
MTTKKTTQDLVKERPSPEELAILERTPINIIVDNVRSLDNVGLIFRLCELSRVEHLYLTGYTGHPRKPNDDREEGLIARHEHRIMKTAVYALPHQPWSFHANPLEVTAKLKDEGHTLIAVEQTSTSRPYHELPIQDYQLPLTIIVGHEREGVREELLNQADHIVEIPIHGHGNSHNVSIATTIVLYHILEKSGLL